jgi:hypothetical protein
MGFKTFLESMDKPRGWILPKGKFENFSNNTSHSEYSLKKHNLQPEEFLLEGAVRVLWNGNEIMFEWMKGKLSQGAEETLTELVKDCFMYSWTVAFEIYDEEWESDFKPYELEREREALFTIRKS